MITNKSGRGGKTSPRTAPCITAEVCFPRPRVILLLDSLMHLRTKTRSQLKCSSPACQGAKTKYINSGKQISSVTLIWLQKPPSYGDAALAVWSVTPGDSKQTFRTSKKEKKCFVSAFDKILYPHHLLIFVLYCFQIDPFPFFTSWFSPSGSLAATPRCGDAGIH